MYYMYDDVIHHKRSKSAKIIIIFLAHSLAILCALVVYTTACSGLQWQEVPMSEGEVAEVDDHFWKSRRDHVI